MQVSHLSKFGLSADLMLDFRRSTRKREVVNYNDDAYDKQLSAALKVQFAKKICVYLLLLYHLSNDFAY